MKRKRGDSKSGNSPGRPKAPAKSQRKLDEQQQEQDGQAEPLPPQGDIAAPKQTKPRMNKKKISQFTSCYSDRYRKLLNESILDLRRPGEPLNLQDSQLKPSQIGGSTWTTEDKEIFFNAVARYGTSVGLSQIANAVQKSEPEVSLYIMTLTGEAAPDADLGALPDHGVVPAATEVTVECSEKLDLAGEALAWRHFMSDIQKERERHGDLWLLTPINVETFDPSEYEESISSEENKDMSSSTSSSDDTKSDDHPSSKKGSDQGRALLNLSTVLELSKAVFMNSTSPDQCWSTHLNTYPIPPDSLKQPLKSPAIFQSAYQDLQTLTIAYLRRLIATAQYQAQSRMRMADTILSRPPPTHVNIETIDVLAAVRILGTKRDTWDYWAELPKRHALEYMWTNNKGYKAQPVDPEIAVAALKGRQIRRFFEFVEEHLGLAKAVVSFGDSGISPGDDDDADGMVLDAPTISAKRLEQVGEEVKTFGSEDIRVQMDERPGAGGRGGSLTEDEEMSDDSEDDHSEDIENEDSPDENSYEEESDVEDSDDDKARDEAIDLEALDTANSFEEERRLWKLLELEAPAK